MKVYGLTSETHWSCPNCTQTHVTHDARQTPGHICPGLRGLSVPFVVDGTDCKIEAVEREDYIGSDNAGRVMSVVTTRADGSNDTAVFAPTAQVQVI